MGGVNPSSGSMMRVGAVAARVAHNHEVIGASPISATKKVPLHYGGFFVY
jgi:hypothetical protein